jgi:hypothetical protein
LRSVAVFAAPGLVEDVAPAPGLPAGPEVLFLVVGLPGGGDLRWAMGLPSAVGNGQ